MTQEHINQIGKKFMALNLIAEQPCAVCDDIGRRVAELPQIKNSWNDNGVKSFIHGMACPHVLKAREELCVAVAAAYESIKTEGPKELTVRDVLLEVERAPARTAFTDERLKTLEEKLYLAGRLMKSMGKKDPVFVLEMPSAEYRDDFENAVYTMLTKKYAMLAFDKAKPCARSEEATLMFFPEYGISVALVEL